MAEAKTNVQLLVEGGVIDLSEMTDEQRRLINEELTQQEVEALIKARGLLKPSSPMKPSEGVWFF